MIGILMLDTAFPRFRGDVGNPCSFTHPVTYSVVRGATPAAIVKGDLAPWVDAFIAAGQELVDAGCTALTTTCGFLTPLRDRVARETSVPVISSALELIPELIAAGRRPGILTISDTDLSVHHLSAAKVPKDVPVQGIGDSHFATAILGNNENLNWEASRKDLIQGANALIRRAPQLDVVVLECTNMPPHAAAIAEATGREVVSILTAVEMLANRVTRPQDNAHRIVTPAE